jgi:ArsR family transcriptional regulator
MYCEIDFSQYFDNTGTMEIITAVERLAALGHETRLAVFRLLIEAGPAGINAGQIAERLDIALATLSFHLAHLTRVGLIKAQPQSRYIFYAADYAAMDELIGYLTANCCQGSTCSPQTTSGAVPKKTRRSASMR